VREYVSHALYAPFRRTRHPPDFSEHSPKGLTTARSPIFASVCRARSTGVASARSRISCAEVSPRGEKTVAMRRGCFAALLSRRAGRQRCIIFANFVDSIRVRAPARCRGYAAAEGIPTEGWPEVERRPAEHGLLRADRRSTVCDPTVVAVPGIARSTIPVLDSDGGPPGFFGGRNSFAEMDRASPAHRGGSQFDAA